MANLSKERRDRMMGKLEELKALHSDDESIMALNEIENALKEKKFGLVFEEHTEAVDEMLLENIPVFTADSERRLCKDESLPWNFIVEGDNLQALYLLEKTHKGKVDCIYIDPPYNTGAKDWKYNNNYVAKDDAYRHSLWLSMMKNRLAMAKKLLNPNGSVLIITIDDKEYLHLGCILEEMFPNAKMTMVSSVINPAGKAKKGGIDFSRTDEYIYFLQIGNEPVLPETREVSETPIAWEALRRHSLANGRGKHGVGSCGPNQFYPFYIDLKSKKIVEIGEPLPENVSRFSVKQIDGCVAVFPVRDNGIEMNWGCVRETAWELYQKGYLRVGQYFPEKPQQFGINYLTKGTIKAIENGEVVVTKQDEIGIVDGYFPVGKPKVPTTNWNKPTHNATSHGTDLIAKIFVDQRFDYPKSLYAVEDCLKLFLLYKPDAIIVDFFAGSGTTMHAVNLLNAEDGGHRKCIMVTNNEISDAEEKAFSERNIHKGDDEWESRGIARYVTWPRTVCAIEGIDIMGKPLKGEYIMSSGTQKSMADGFKANVKYYKCDWVPRSSTERTLTEILFEHVREMVEIENHIEVDGKNYAIILDEEQADTYEKTWENLTTLKGIYLSKNVLLTTTQNALFYSKPVNIIPDYYFNIEMKEVGEAW